MRPVRLAEIVAVGSELLTAFRLDTNSLFLTGRLNDLGIEVRAKAVVGDDRRDLAAVLGDALRRADVVLTTGGLGPTEDDVTREAVAALAGVPLELDEALLEALRGRFASRGLSMPDINRRQAMVPRGARVLPNPNGTAPGLVIEIDDRPVVLLPGPPRELRPLFEAQVAPMLASRADGRRLRRRVIKLTGRGESHVEELAHPIYSTLGAPGVDVQTSILASPGQIELHLTGHGADVAVVDRVLDDGVERLKTALSPWVFSVDGRSLEEVVGDLLRARGWRIAVAESCTGGLVLGRLTETPGSSEWVIGGVVAYDNQVKVRELGVPADLLAAHGAVSEPVAERMASGVRERFGADVGIGVTGIAGPSGGSDAKPVGTVVIARAGRRPMVRTFRFPGDRAAVRAHSVAAALEMVRRELVEPDASVSRP